MTRRIAINKICLNTLSYEAAVEACARHGFAGITPWIGDVEHLTPAQARKIAADAGVEIAGFCNAGLYALKGRAGRATAQEEARRNIDYAAEIESPSIVTVVGGLPDGTKALADAHDYALDCLAETLDHARTTPVTLALEPLHPVYTPDWSMVNTIGLANDWCNRLGDGIGLTVDSYHTWWDHNLETEIARAGAAGRLTSMHVSDWLVPTSHLLLDRGMPGDGVIDLAGFDALMRGAGYDGFVEVEIFSERWWAEDVDAFLGLLRSRMDAILT